MTELFADVDPEPRPWSARGAPWVRRTILVLFAVFLVAALANVFGQEASESVASGPAARLTLSAPDTVRGGLLFQARIEIRPRSAIEQPRLVLAGRGWLEGMQVNSIEPQPAEESGAGDDLLLSYDRLAPGHVLTVWLQFQVDPTSVGTRPADVQLLDGMTQLASIHHSIAVLP